MTNMDQFINNINDIIKTDKLERSVFGSVHANILDRIFSKGLDAKNTSIGRYSKGYLKTRIKNNWTASKKVILQFSGQMKNDFSLIKQGRQWGSGFKNSKNGNKSIWVEDTYDKAIFAPTKKEIKLANELYANEAIRLLRRG